MREEPTKRRGQTATLCHDPNNRSTQNQYQEVRSLEGKGEKRGSRRSCMIRKQEKEETVAS